MTRLYETVDGYRVEEGETIYWKDTHTGRWNKSTFEVDYRYGELYEIKLGYEQGGYTTCYSLYDLEKKIYKHIPQVEL